MAKLTVLDIRHAKGTCRLSDGEGLFFEITSTVVKRWLYRFKINGKNGMYVIGRYPELSLKQARIKHQEAKQLVKQGIKPGKVRREIRTENIERENKEKDFRTKSFQYIAEEWIEQQKSA
jgi:hypothetical protein